MKIIFISILILASSCKSQKNLSQEIDDNGLTLLVQDGYFYTDTMETAVIEDEKTLKTFFSRVNKTRKPGLPVPQIDFEKEMVLVVCMGEQKTNEMPYLRFLESNEKEINIAIEMTNTTGKNIYTTSYPFCVYKIPISKHEVVFNKL